MARSYVRMRYVPLELRYQEQYRTIDERQRYSFKTPPFTRPLEWKQRGLDRVGRMGMAVRLN